MSNNYKRMSLSYMLKNKLIKNKLNLHEPFFDEEEKKILNKSISLKNVSTAGNTTNIFEKKIAQLTNVKYAIATNSGTSALHLALIACGIEKGDEVLMPSLNYIATANACLYLGAIPHFVDVEYDTLGIDVDRLLIYLNKISTVRKKVCFNKITKRKIKAIAPLHIFGHPCKIDKIKTIAKKFKLFLIEDAAEGLGSYFKRKHVGTFGDMGVLSFNGNKIITTGAGGAILTNNKKLAKRIFSLSTINKINHKWKYEYNEIGYNYRMPSLNSSLGIAQIKKLQFFIKKKRKIFFIYKKIFKNQTLFKLFEEAKYCKSNYWLQTIILNKNNKKIRDKFINLAHKQNLNIRPVWRPVHKSKHMLRFPKMELKNTNDLENRIINLPSSPSVIKFLRN
jgi:perosamine synthetase